MKTISASLLSLLQSGSPMHRADLITIALPNGQGIYAVHGAWDVYWAGAAYMASKYGVWERGTITSSAGFALESSSMTLSCVADSSVLIPGTTASLMSKVTSGFFDGAVVSVDTLYMPLGQWGNVIGAVSQFAGMIVDVKRAGRSKAEFNVRDWLFLLNLKIPKRVIQPGCYNTVFDSHCLLSSSAFAFPNVVAAGSAGGSAFEQAQIVPENGWPTTDGHGNNPSLPPYFSQGKIQFTSGQNSGLWYHVALQSTGQVGGNSVGIQSIVRYKNVVTVTTQTAHGLTAGSYAAIENVGPPPAPYNTVDLDGIYEVVTVPNVSQFTYAQQGPDAAGTGGEVLLANGALNLSMATLFPVAVGDTFTAYPGCDKRLSTCTAKFNNAVHFRGFPFVPPPEQSA